MSTLTRRKLIQASAAVAAATGAGVLNACAPTVTPSPSASAVATAAKPRAGGTMVWAAEADPVSMNPITNSSFASTQGFEHSYESLVMYDAKMKIVPALAESWQTPNDTTYIFKLRRGVKFHDGKDLTAEDVKYTFDTVLDPKGVAVWRANFDQVDKVEVVDPQTVRFTTKTPFPPLLGAMAIMRSSSIVPTGALERGKLDTQIVGTGPFKLTEYVPKDFFKLTKNKEYWGTPLPYLDEVTFKILLEEDARIAGLRGGSLDFGLISAEGLQRVKSDANIVTSQAPAGTLYVMFPNMTRKPWNDVRVRQAISLAMNRQDILDKVFASAAQLSGPVATGHQDYYVQPTELATRYKQDLAKARQLLTDAGVANGQTLDLLVSVGEKNFPPIAVIFVEQMKQIGIDVKIRQVEGGVFSQQAGPTANFNYDWNVNGFSPRHDPDGFLYARFHSAQTFAVGYKNAQLDDLLVKARTTIDLAQRHALYNQAQQILIDEVPCIWLGVSNRIEAVRSRVNGYEQSVAARRDWALKNSWLAA
jgi:peptide/nickel transport system substrate-binding protein